MLDIQEATHDQLKTAREEINIRIRELEISAVQELEERAAQFGLQLLKNGQPLTYQPAQRRTRRTKAQIEADKAQPHTTQPPPLSVIR